MYKENFEISWNYWNNTFWYKINKESKIIIPSLIDGTLNDLQIWESVAFREMEKWYLKDFVWLKFFVRLEWNKLNTNYPTIYIFDNHNHALFFWFQEFLEGNFDLWIDLVHIDQHTDMNKNENIILENKEKKDFLKDIFEFTNYKCNVWNFILPAKKFGLIWDIIQINSEYSLMNFDFENKKKFILDIDLDFWDPKMWIENIKWTFEIIRKVAKQAKFITIATSPYFLDQKLAINLVKEIFGD